MYHILDRVEREMELLLRNDFRVDLNDVVQLLPEFIYIQYTTDEELITLRIPYAVDRFAFLAMSPRIRFNWLVSEILKRIINTSTLDNEWNKNERER